MRKVRGWRFEVVSVKLIYRRLVGWGPNLHWVATLSKFMIGTLGVEDGRGVRHD